MSRLKKKFPVNRVKVGARIYQLVEWDADEANSRERFAEVDHHTQVIRVTFAYGLRAAGLNLVHELIHCVCWQGVLDPEDGEERTVSKAANLWNTIWCDNAKLFSWLHEVITDTTDDLPSG